MSDFWGFICLVYWEHTLWDEGSRSSQVNPDWAAWYRQCRRIRSTTKALGKLALIMVFAVSAIYWLSGPAAATSLARVFAHGFAGGALILGLQLGWAYALARRVGVVQ